MNPKLNKKVKKFLDAYFKGTSASSPEAHHALMFILKGALTDANFHSTSKKVDKLFPKAKNAKYFGKKDWEDSLEDKGVDIATMAKWDGHDIIDAIGFFVSMYVGGPLGKKIGALKNESFKREHKLLESLSVLVEKNVPTNPSKWSYYKSQAKKKFDVYPSAYANAWAAKQYKAAGGGWRTTKENVEEETIEEKISVFDERHFGKNGLIIMIDDNGKKVSAIFKNKKNSYKYNRNNPAHVKKLLQLAKKTKFPKAIDEKTYGISDDNPVQFEAKYNYKADALTAYFKGKIDAKELDSIARNQFKSGIATKKELSNFLSNKFTQDVMSDTYGIPAGTLVKRVRGLMKFAEGMNEDKKQVKDLVKKVKFEKIFYDVLSTMEKKFGKRKYRMWLEKSLKDFGENPKHYDYRTNAAIEEKLFQLGK